MTASSAPMPSATAQPVRAVGLSGSLRRESFNTMLLANAVQIGRPWVEIEVFDRIRDIPLFDADVADEGDPPAVAALRAAIRSSDAVVIATPEYNYGVPGVLKNALDWVSLPPGEGGLEGKPVAIMGASTSILGTARAQTQLRSLFVFTRSHVVNFPEVFVTRAATRFDSSGALTDRVATMLVGHLLTSLVALTHQLNGAAS